MTLESPGLADLFAARPARTALQSLLPLFLAGALSVNAAVHDAGLTVVVGFSLVMCAFAAGATRHSLARFRTETLEADLFEQS